MKSYDKIPENEDMLLDLPFREGAGALTHDHAKPHHPMTLLDPGGGSFTWDSLVTGLGVLTFVTIGGGATDGVNIHCPGADSADLNFIAGDYSLGAWIRWTDDAISQIVMGRYVLNVSGWELYLTKIGAVSSLTQRHHHAGTLVGGNPRSGCFSVGWNPDTWFFMGTSRTGGGEAQHYRNGVALEMVTSGLVDPETSAQAFKIGSRYTADANWYKGPMWRPRIWGRALTAREWMTIYLKELKYFVT